MTSAKTRLRPAQIVNELLRDPERKSLMQIIFECSYLSLKYQVVPSYYFSRYLFKKDKGDVVNYFPSKFLYQIKAKFNEKEVCDVLENKLFFDFYYRQFNFNLPVIWMYNHRQIFVIDNQRVDINSVDDFIHVLRTLITTRAKDQTIFIKKTYSSYGGDNIYKIHLDDLTTSPEKVKHIYEVVIQTGFLFQETVKQHHEMDRLNPYCLNTMRLDTFINSDNHVEIISAYLKTNLKNHYIDNEPTGGCEISIDLTTGKLARYGSLTIKYNGLKRPAQHPTTQIVFEHYIVPHFKEAKELVIRAAEAMPGLRLVGWDVAIGEDGPILIEGNSDYDIAANDLAYGGYRSNPVFQKVLREIGYLR
jgi:hypothetical protein